MSTPNVHHDHDYHHVVYKKATGQMTNMSLCHHGGFGGKKERGGGGLVVQGHGDDGFEGQV